MIETLGYVLGWILWVAFWVAYVFGGIALCLWFLLNWWSAPSPWSNTSWPPWR